MGQADIEIQAIMWKWFVPAAVGFVVYTLFGKGFLAKLNKWARARMMNHAEKAFNEALGTRKRTLFKELHAMSEEAKPHTITILDIGAGTGANFQYFPDGCNVMCVDPNPYCESYLKSKQELFAHVNIAEFVIGKAEDLSVFPDESLEAVVCTLVLCCVDDVDQALKEIKRVLRPGGKLLYIEHVKADDKSWRCSFQKLLRVPWAWISDGCSLVRQTWKNVEAAGFSHVSQEKFTASMKLPQLVMATHVVGVATK